MTPVGQTLATAPVVARRPRRLAQRHLWLIPGLALGLYANVQAGVHGIGLVTLVAFGVVPHLPVLLGIGQPHAQGQLAARAVPLFNATHHPVPPLVVLGLAAAGVLSPFWFVAAVAWLGHIVVDEAFDAGLRTHDGWRRPWWTPADIGGLRRGRGPG